MLIALQAPIAVLNRSAVSVDSAINISVRLAQVERGKNKERRKGETERKEKEEGKKGD